MHELEKLAKERTKEELKKDCVNMLLTLIRAEREAAIRLNDIRLERERLLESYDKGDTESIANMRLHRDYR